MAAEQPRYYSFNAFLRERFGEVLSSGRAHHQAPLNAKVLDLGGHRLGHAGAKQASDHLGRPHADVGVELAHDQIDRFLRGLTGD